MGLGAVRLLLGEALSAGSMLKDISTKALTLPLLSGGLGWRVGETAFRRPRWWGLGCGREP